MNVTRLLALVLLLLVSVAPKAAASPDLKRTCVDASTEGQTQRDEGHLLEARAQLLICAQDACPGVVRKSCLEWLADVEARTPSIVVRAVDGSGADITDATLTIDGSEHALDGRAVPLDPGAHTITITQASGTQSEQKVLLTEREKDRQVTVQLGAPVDAEGTPGLSGSFSGAGDSAAEGPKEDAGYSVPVGAWVLGAVGIVGVGAFAYLQLSASKELDELECAPLCSSEETEPGKRKLSLSYIPLGVGAAAIAGAVTWGIVSWRKSKKDGANLALVPLEEGGFVSLSGRF